MEIWSKIEAENQSEIDQRPSSRNFHSSIVINNDLIIFGGKSNGNLFIILKIKKKLKRN